ncbi:MAG TPA: DNA polymerase III subunit alpha, partial [bacterium]|nr:DNA polymerase III subunit alpha [bacterium]
MSNQPFVHLHVHSHYSLLDGMGKIDELVEAAKADGATAVALTDHGVMYGVVEFYQKCQKAGIKPIIGVEAYLTPGSRHDKNSQIERSYHLILLAKDQVGYNNLLKLVSIAHLEGFYYKPRIDWECLQKYSQGLIAMSACLAGEIPRLIMSGKKEQAKKRALEYNQLFGQGNYYLELQDHPHLPEQEKVNQELIKLSQATGIPLVATNDVHYIRASDRDVQDVLLCLQTKHKKNDAGRMNMLEDDYSFRPSAEMAAAFAAVPEAINNTVKIADQCNLELAMGQVLLPRFTVPNDLTAQDYLRQLCLDGLVKRYGQTYEEIEPLYRERMDYELEIIAKMGFPDYFLIVADFINWAKNNAIVVGPGRGSAAGSLVCYLIGITELCPIAYDLLFERFLNPDRISMPDIDTDFADIRREDVIEYVSEKYGRDHVSQIITFGTMAARAAIRDVGRVLDASYDFCDKLAKMVPMFMKLPEALEQVAELKQIYQQDPQAKQILDYAQRLEGCARHTSTHACGVLITKDPLTEYTPIQYASSTDRTVVCQYSLHPVEDLGLLKMDFLGLKNLTIIESAIRIIKATKGIEIDINQIPLDDQETFGLFQRGETTGVFQFESSGMKRYLRDLKPTNLEDIIAMVALYRPGPMEWIPDYIAGKHGRKKPQYLHPKLEPILAKTYGVAIYQEQVMQIARSLAGFTMGQADVLRKAMGKKIAKLLAEQKEKFIAGCVNNGVSQTLAEKVFSFIEPFAGYGFNRSHAACYAMVAYQTAYLKAKYPTAFMAALLAADQQNSDRVAIEIDECRHMGIEVCQPDINQSFDSFTVVNEALVDKPTIRFGLLAIKNVGEHIAEVIKDERKTNGHYQDIADFLRRITDKDLNRKSLESLIKAGAFDAWHDRQQLVDNLDILLKYNKDSNQNRLSGQNSLFAGVSGVEHQPLVLRSAPPVNRQTKLGWERELLGLYITEHPFVDFKKQLGSALTPIKDLAALNNEQNVTIGGMVVSSKKIMTRANQSMLFVKLEDETGSTEVIVFPTLLATSGEVWQDGQAILCQGTISDKDNERKILADKAIYLTLDNLTDQLATFRELPGQKRRAKSGNWSGPVVVNSADRSATKETANSLAEQFDLILNQEFDQDQLVQQADQKIRLMPRKNSRGRCLQLFRRHISQPGIGHAPKRLPQIDLMIERQDFHRP